MRVEDVPDPQIKEPTDAIIRVTTTGLCGSDLHLYEPLAPFMTPGDIVGHEPMGIVEEVGSAVSDLRAGDRVVVPFNISCGSCWTCDQGLFSQCETTQNRDTGTGASLLGYSKLYGAVPGGQAEYLRVQFADFLPVKVPEGPSDDRFVYLSDVLPTAWQAVAYAGIPDGGTVAVLGCGPIGDMATRIAVHLGYRVITVDLVPERLERARTFGAEVVYLRDTEDLGETIREMTGGRGPDSVIDAVGMEAHGSPTGKVAQTVAGFLPDKVGEKLMNTAGIDRLASLHASIDVVRRGGTVSVIGVYGGMADPMPMMTMFDKQIQFRMGQANVKRWVDDIMPLLGDDDPLEVDDFATHRLPLSEAAHGYEIFQKKADNACKVVLTP
jgi:threonine dehydrogenase-like Zn-dependent dehydrogenase